MASAVTERVTTVDAAPSVWVIGDRVRFMGSVDGGNLGVVDVTVMPGSGTPPHRHPSPEIFRVTEGEVTFGIFAEGAPRVFAAREGTVVTVPPWLGHNYCNPSDRPARFTAVLETEMLQFFKEVGTTDMPPAGPSSDEAIGQIMAACARHGIEVLGAN